jgi:hypothetical protein
MNTPDRVSAPIHENFILFARAEIPAGLGVDRLCPNMEPSLILIAEGHTQFNRGAQPCDDCGQKTDPIRLDESKFPSSPNRPIVLNGLPQHN